MALTGVPPGKLATIVTTLEMTDRPKAAPLAPSPLRLVRWKTPEPHKYRTLFRRVGEPWLWFSRLIMTDDALLDIITDDSMQIFAICDPQGIEVGLLELDFRETGRCLIGFFGIIPQLTGQGFGGWLMAQTLMLGWRKGVERINVQTCTLDHAGALAFYIKSGFRPISRAIETFDDPRLLGILSEDAAPHVPLLQPL